MSTAQRSQVRLISCWSTARQLTGLGTHRRRDSVQVGSALMLVREQVEQSSVQRRHQSGTCALAASAENSKAIMTRIDLLRPRIVLAFWQTLEPAVSWVGCERDFAL